MENSTLAAKHVASRTGMTLESTNLTHRHEPEADITGQASSEESRMCSPQDVRRTRRHQVGALLGPKLEFKN